MSRDKTTVGSRRRETHMSASWRYRNRQTEKGVEKMGPQKGKVDDTGTWYGRHVPAPRLTNAVLLMK